MTSEEKRKYYRDYIKNWRLKNPSKVKEYKKRYRQKQADKILQYNQEWVKQNYEHRKEYQKKWGQKNRLKRQNQRKEMRRNLKDNYIKSMLSCQFDIKFSLITIGVVGLKRRQVLLNRLIKQGKGAQDASVN